MKTGSEILNTLPPHWKKVFVFATAFFKTNAAVSAAGILGFDGRRPRLFEIISAILNNSLNQENIDNLYGEYKQLLQSETAVARLRQVLEQDGAALTSADL